MCRDAVRRFIPQFWKLLCRLTLNRLAYCELYVTLGRVFRQFDSLKTPGKSREEMLYDDYFSSYHPEKYNQFLFTSND